MYMIEQLRDRLHKAIEMGLNDEILNISRALDRAILKYIKAKYSISNRFIKMKPESALFVRRKEMHA